MQALITSILSIELLETIMEIEILVALLQIIFFISNVFVYIKNKKTSTIIIRNIDKLDKILLEDMDKRIDKTIERYILFNNKQLNR